MFTLSLFTSLRFKGFNQRSLDGRLMLTIACPFSSLRLLEENTREPISGEKTRAQHSRPGVHCSDHHQRQTPEIFAAGGRGRWGGIWGCRWGWWGWHWASTPPSLGTLLSHKKWEPNWREMADQQTWQNDLAEVSWFFPVWWQDGNCLRQHSVKLKFSNDCWENNDCTRTKNYKLSDVFQQTKQKTH